VQTSSKRRLAKVEEVVLYFTFPFTIVGSAYPFLIARITRKQDCENQSHLILLKVQWL
jgi:hypothetical protein